MADGTVRAWGSQAEGQSAGSADDQLTPALVATLSGVTRVAAGARHSLARSSTGQWYGWGSNREGQLGLTGTVGGSTPLALATAGLADVAGGLDAAPALSVAQALRYYGYDAQGSVRYQTDAAGAVTARYDYDAFGTLLGTAGESPVGSDAYLYRSERYDALTGLYHLRARDYDPALGRFHQIDDFAGFPENPYSLNRYNYAESNPVGNFDPAGRFAVTSLTAVVYALHLKDQYLQELASAGPQFTFDPDEALNRYLGTDHLIAAGAPLKLKERELWVRASGGGLLGSWVNESGSSTDSELPNPQEEYAGGRGFGAGSDVFFLHQSGARFRQGWALRQVEQAWGALQQSRLSLNMGPRFPDDPRSARIAAGNVRLKGARWADAIYADALLQATLRSSTEPGRRGVRAHFTPTVEGRRYDATGIDLTARATTALNAASGGGPVDWEEAAPVGGDNFQVSAHAANFESPIVGEFLQALTIQSVIDNWLRSAATSPYAASSARAFLLTEENGDNVSLGLLSAYVVGTPWVGDIAQNGYNFKTGRDFTSGEKLTTLQRSLSGVAVALEVLPGFGHAVGEGVGSAVGLGVRATKKSTAVVRRAAGAGLDMAGEAARRGLVHAQAAGAIATTATRRVAQATAQRTSQIAKSVREALQTEVHLVGSGTSRPPFGNPQRGAVTIPSWGAAENAGGGIIYDRGLNRFRDTATGRFVRKVDAPASVQATAWQGSGNFPGIDVYRNITLKKGTVIYGGYPGPSNYFTTASAVRRAKGSASVLGEGLQTLKSTNPKYLDPVTGGYRGYVRAYEVTEDIEAAFGIARANGQHGAGGLPQIFIPDSVARLKPVNTTRLGP
ncbi:MAG: hypothetical protein H7067_07000 [Burkholderiales bacterium]|nr:hypothetical protein [Opitutaceae bacterium]